MICFRLKVETLIIPFRLIPLFLCFNLVQSPILKEKDYLIDYPIYDIELIFVELPKFKKQLSELKFINDKWLYFLTESRSLVQVPEIMAEVPEIKKAFYIANQANLSLDELEDQEKSEIFIQDQRGAITKAIKDGLQQGIHQGIQQNKLEMARKMLNLIDDQVICQITGLSITELEALKMSNL
jgi:predicted transposase/invertase (TIGR01784 family)